MKILFVTNHLWDYTGSELNLIGLARAMAARGHEVACHAIFIAPRMLAGIQEMGIRVLAEPDGALVEFAPDAIFCQHHSSAAMVRSRLPLVPIVLAHLGVEPELEQAPLLDCGVGLHLAISEEMQDALISQNVPASRIRIFRNAVDASLQDAKGDRPARSEVLLFSYKLANDASALIAAAAKELGMALDIDSLTRRGEQNPATIAARLRTARLVFASGRSALEAAISGAAVVVVGPKGLDGALTAATWRHLAAANFSGRRRAIPLTRESVRQAIDDALQSDVEATGMQLHAEFSLYRRAEELEMLLSAPPPPALAARDLALNARLSQLLHEQRWMAVHQRQLEQQADRTSWWRRLLRRAGK